MFIRQIKDQEAILVKKKDDYKAGSYDTDESECSSDSEIYPLYSPYSCDEKIACESLQIPVHFLANYDTIVDKILLLAQASMQFCGLSMNYIGYSLMSVMFATFASVCYVKTPEFFSDYLTFSTMRMAISILIGTAFASGLLGPALIVFIMLCAFFDFGLAMQVVTKKVSTKFQKQS
jgi:hypothetical protein